MLNSKSRRINSVRNISIGVVCQVVGMLFSFISRTIFIKQLGAEYLGVKGLYDNILTVLCLAELGVEYVMVYSLYKPIAEKKQETITALLNYYKWIYRKMAVVVLVLGLSIIPFMDKIINSDLPYKDLLFYYLLFLLNSVVSYFAAYKIALINADQKNYIIKMVQTACVMIRDITQIIVLITTKNYTLYLYILIISNVLTNIFLSRIADRLYPFITLKSDPTKIETKTINENIKSAFLYKIGAIIMNNTDNILISILIGTTYVGYYSNYSLIVGAVTMFISIVIQALFSSIGNLNANTDMEKSYQFFNTLLLFFHWLTAFCCLCLLLVLNDFLTIWIGESYLLGIDVVLAIVFNFYIQNIINPVRIYRDTMGLFSEIKYVMLIASVINLILSIVLGLKYGVAGILISTGIAKIMTTLWFEPRLLYSAKFKQPIKHYWLRQMKYFMATIMAAYVTIKMTNNMPISLIFIMLKVFIAFVVISVTFLITNFKAKEFKSMFGYVVGFIKK
jgi:O-antigen/teichoic acid export membrane protein